MQPSPHSKPANDPPPAEGASSLGLGDAVQLIRLGLQAAPHRNDPRAWRIEVLEGLLRALPAAGAAAFVLKGVGPETAPVIASMVEAGFKGEAQRQAFRQEFNAAGFRDLFSRRALHEFAIGRQETLTLLRSQMVPDHAFHADAHTHAFRTAVGVDDCVMSMSRGAEMGSVYVLKVFRPLPYGGDAGHGALAQRFAGRERTVLEALHQGLTSIYRVEESTQRLSRAAELPPRLRQTLECLLTGVTERQTAEKLSLSVHTVHDYVKALYQHFGVSSRGELMAKWIQTTGQVPRREDETPKK